jgi:hypothetical protein
LRHLVPDDFAVTIDRRLERAALLRDDQPLARAGRPVPLFLKNRFNSRIAFSGMVTPDSSTILSEGRQFAADRVFGTRMVAIGLPLIVACLN